MTHAHRLKGRPWLVQELSTHHELGRRLLFHRSNSESAHVQLEQGAHELLRRCFFLRQQRHGSSLPERVPPLAWLENPRKYCKGEYLCILLFIKKKKSIFFPPMMLKRAGCVLCVCAMRACLCVRMCACVRACRDGGRIALVTCALMFYYHFHRWQT